MTWWQTQCPWGRRELGRILPKHGGWHRQHLSYEGQNDFPLGNWVDWKVDSTSTDEFEWEIADGLSIEVDALVMEGCNDVQFGIIRPEANALFTDTLYLTVEGTAEEGKDFDPLFTQVIMEAGVTETNAVLGTEIDDSKKGLST